MPNLTQQLDLTISGAAGIEQDGSGQEHVATGEELARLVLLEHEQCPTAWPARHCPLVASHRVAGAVA